MLAGMLMPLGFDVREAASGGECLASLHESVPDAILLDITMDDMDGWPAATRLRAAGYTDVPIIMVSANVFKRGPAPARGPVPDRGQAGARIGADRRTAWHT